MAILVTGGAGFIGSHTCVELLRNGFNVITIDSLVNSSIEIVEKIRRNNSMNDATNPSQAIDDALESFNTLEGK